MSAKGLRKLPEWSRVVQIGIEGFHRSVPGSAEPGVASHFPQSTGHDPLDYVRPVRLVFWELACPEQSSSSFSILVHPRTGGTVCCEVYLCTPERAENRSS